MARLIPASAIQFSKSHSLRRRRPAPVPDPIGDDRAIQYPEAVVTEPRGRGVLDAPLEPVIGLAEGETRWRGMTAVGDANLRSRGTKCPSCWKLTALEIIRGRRECRMRVAPEAACA